ncbi:hypothetical protein NDU88_007455 [Pleurodeles waltl]|uniref:Uncharacterized protein n=1 Tax=Pleurodeles waltl TaxID=8319 RepID=A0AAV7NXF3_PLEWA|nr:hypothetical protein NDU88_007455 [Pleurodeles waltl]
MQTARHPWKKRAPPSGRTGSEKDGVEALKHSSAEDPPPLPRTNIADDTQGATMDRVLQEISAVSRKLEGMDNAMVALTAETRSMRLDVAGFQS